VERVERKPDEKQVIVHIRKRVEGRLCRTSWAFTEDEYAEIEAEARSRRIPAPESIELYANAHQTMHEYNTHRLN